MRQVITYYLFIILQTLSCFARQGEWRKVDGEFAGTIAYKSLKCFDSKNCVAAGNEGFYIPLIKISKDGGYTWHEILREPPGEKIDSNGNRYNFFPLKIADIAFKKNNIFSIGDSGSLWLSGNQGISWKYLKLYSIAAPGLLDYNIDMFDDKFGAIACPIDLFVTFDGWKTYKYIELDIPDSLKPHAYEDIVCPNANFIVVLAYRTGLGYYIVSSNDGGLSWIANQPIKPMAFKIYFLNSVNGYAVAGQKVNTDVYKDLIYHTLDGGKTWITQLDTIEPYPGGLNKIFFYDSLNGVAIGYWHKMWRTSDAGNTWIKDTSFNNSINADYFSDIVMLSPTDMIGVTESSGEIYRYTEDWSSTPDIPYPSDKDEILVYPSPVRVGTEFNLLFLSVGSYDGEIAVYNALGERLYSDNIFIQESKNNILIKPAILSSGSYFLVLKKNTGDIIIKPFVVY